MRCRLRRRRPGTYFGALGLTEQITRESLRAAGSELKLVNCRRPHKPMCHVYAFRYLRITTSRLLPPRYATSGVLRLTPKACIVPLQRVKLYVG